MGTLFYSSFESKYSVFLALYLRYYETFYPISQLWSALLVTAHAREVRTLYSDMHVFTHAAVISE
jgi:hypothetical protein